MAYFEKKKPPAFCVRPKSSDFEEAGDASTKPSTSNWKRKLLGVALAGLVGVTGLVYNGLVYLQRAGINQALNGDRNITRLAEIPSDKKSMSVVIGDTIHPCDMNPVIKTDGISVKSCVVKDVPVPRYFAPGHTTADLTLYGDPLASDPKLSAEAAEFFKIREAFYADKAELPKGKPYHPTHTTPYIHAKISKIIHSKN